MKKDLNQVFDELVVRYANAIEKNYLSRYKRAKDKEFIKEELKKGTDFMIDFTFLEIEKGKLLTHFLDWYKRGENISDILDHLRKTFGEIDDELPFRRIENGQKITLYLSEEEQNLKKLALNERKLMKFLIRDTAYREIQKRLPLMFDEPKTISEKDTPISYAVTWTGKKDNKNEFVQLIYGLHKAGFINGGDGEITKIVESLAGVFKIDLGKGWQANHSSSIHRANKDYQPPIFDKIRDAYEQYVEEQTEIKKKKSK
ncbi:MAG: RteC domain-containing protein [Bacteroidetes bacterium]|nr:RteC domain-containing protein [Bacteroidota bacterium]